MSALNFLLLFFCDFQMYLRGNLRVRLATQRKFLRDNRFLGLFSCSPCYLLLQQSRGKHACSDGVSQTPRGFGIYYSKTILIQRDDREYAVTWLQQQGLIKHTQNMIRILPEYVWNVTQTIFYKALPSQNTILKDYVKS